MQGGHIEHSSQDIDRAGTRTVPLDLRSIAEDGL